MIKIFWQSLVKTTNIKGLKELYLESLRRCSENFELLLKKILFISEVNSNNHMRLGFKENYITSNPSKVHYENLLFITKFEINPPGVD